jgi:hypothetical protein
MSKWPKSISVDKRIVQILSKSTYESFPNAIKEIITNSYDADSSKVNITIDVKNEMIIVEDNGWGMSENDFDLYLRIAGEDRDKKGRTFSKRYIIGQFGVGFLAVFPFFQNYYIESKKAGLSESMYGEVQCYRYFTDKKINNISDIKIDGGLKHGKKSINESYTKIILTGFTDLSKEFFKTKKDVTHRKNSIHKLLKPIDKLKWQLSEDLPIRYDNNKFPQIFKEFSPNLNFEVFVNDDLLTRNMYGKYILEDCTEQTSQIGNIKFYYFIVTNRKAVVPFEARHLKLRNLNVGVGDRTSFGLGTEVGGARSRLHWLSGEIIIVEGLNELINVSRDNFNFSSNYEKLKEFFIKKLSHYSNKLEREAQVKQFMDEKTEDIKIKNIRLLDPINVQKKIDKFSSSDIKVSPEIFTKQIKLYNKKYDVELGNWNYNEDLEPACKIQRNKIIINKSYPLFKKIKYTDIFVKLHLLLLLNYQEGKLTKPTYSKITKDILNFYKDYYD